MKPSQEEVISLKVNKSLKSSPSNRIPLANPIFDKEMEEAALYALHNERFVSGESVNKFEEEFAKFCEAEHAVSVNSGTDALHLSLIALGIRNPDQVITSTFSFVASANVILHVGATPILADVDMRSYNIDPEQITKRMTKQTKAVIPVHLYGYPCDMQHIMDIAGKNGIAVLEDACQAHGAEINGGKVGSIGDVGCFSFYPSKNMTVCGDGGMVVTNDDKTAQMIAKLRDCGRKTRYVHDIIGYTARLNTVNAAIGRIQLKKLDKWNDSRRKIAALYNHLLSDLEEVILPPSETAHIKPVYHLYVIRVQRRERLKEWLENNGIDCGVHYPVPIHLQPIYQKLYSNKFEYPNSEVAADTCLSIPMFPTLKDDEIKFISEKIHEFYDRKTYDE